MDPQGIGDLPVELTCRPMACIALLGLHVESSSVHSTILESFNTSRQQTNRAPIGFKNLPEGHAFPKAKSKRSSYEWYVPKGLLKTNWLSKHLNKVPAVSVLFRDLDWDDPLWNDRRTECASSIELLRSSLQGRNTKVALVLIQKNAPLPGGEDVLATERAASLCSACDLSAKSLFVLPYTDHLFGYTMRLENAFYELAQSYYHQEIKRIKNHREYLNKTTHQLLFVRHQFKIAFLNELRQDIPTALKHYKQAYANLMEVRAADSNMLEVKTIAGFINYKICRLSFLMNTPVDAISQFRKHVDIFKNKTGPPELLFEHSAWMCKQFSHFGDIFEEAVKQGLIAIQTQHPGFYYQQAANHAITRKQLCYRLCEDAKEYPSSDPLAGKDAMEYYGQRSWRPGNQSIEPPDPQREADGVKALQYWEINKVDHSMLVISLLSSAVAQFKKYRCPRMKKQLMVQMGEEYYSCQDYAKALTLLSHVLWDYRAERWQTLVSTVLNTALRSAYHAACVQEFITLGLEYISSWIQASAEEKMVIQNGISNIYKGSPPLALPGVTEDEAQQVTQLWVSALATQQERLVFSVEMTTIIPFVECKARFTSPTFSAEERVSLQVYLRANCPQPMNFLKLSILFSNSHYNSQCQIVANGVEDSREDMYITPRKTRAFRFSFLAQVADIGSDIQITSVALHLGSESCCTVLCWPSGTGSSLTPNLAWSHSISHTPSNGEDVSFNHFTVQSTTRIVPRKPHLTIQVQHRPPALLDEFYPIILSVTNDESSEITQVLMTVGLHEFHDNPFHLTTHFCHQKPQESEKCVPQIENVALGEMAASQEVKEQFFVQSSQTGEIRILVRVSYVIDVEVGDQIQTCTCLKEEVFDVETVVPFEFSTKLLTMKCEQVQHIRSNIPFLLKVDVSSCSPLPVQLVTSCLKLSSHITALDQELTSCVAGVLLKKEEVAGDCFCLMISTPTNELLTLGSYVLEWKRLSSLLEVPLVQTVSSLPSTSVLATLLHVKLQAPAHGWVRTPLSVVYHLHNHTTSVQDIELVVDSSDAFMYAGNKQLHFQVLPLSDYRLKYNLYPLISGYVLLPRLRMVLNPGSSNSMSMDDIVQEMVPSHIFIMPQGKSSPLPPAT